MCDADPSVNREWFEAGSANVIELEVDVATRHALVDLSCGPPPLQTLSACVVRKCLAGHQVNGVVMNADSLPLPSSIKALIKLEFSRDTGFYSDHRATISSDSEME